MDRWGECCECGIELFGLAICTDADECEARVRANNAEEGGSAVEFGTFDAVGTPIPWKDTRTARQRDEDDEQDRMIERWEARRDDEEPPRRWEP